MRGPINTIPIGTYCTRGVFKLTSVRHSSMASYTESKVVGQLSPEFSKLLSRPSSG